MRKFYYAVLTVMCGLCSLNVHAQTVQIGTGTSVPGNTLYAPIYRFSNSSTTDYARSNILYTAAELSAAGITAGANINSIAFYKAGTGATVGDASFQILMANSSATPPLATSTTWSSIQSTHTVVYNSATQSIPATTGWITFDLPTPFNYTGGSLEIAFDWNISGVSGSPTTAEFDWQYTTGFAGYIVGGVSTSSPPATLNATTSGYKHRPNIQITYTPGSACTTLPTAGSATASPSTPQCAGSAISLGLTGNSVGSGQTYIWQKSSSSAGPFTDESTSSNNSNITVNPTVTTWYRAAVTCSGSTTYSDPVEVLVNPALPAGTYTIYPSQPTGSGNYASFADAINALSCGIAGPVVFLAEPNYPYNEQVTIPQVQGASVTNTIAFYGNNATIGFAPTSAARQVVRLDGADHITFKHFTISVQSGSTYGWGVHLTNGANYNSIDSCVIDVSAVTSTTQSNSAGIVASGSTTSVTADGNASNNTISNNTIIGAYQGIIINGSSGSLNARNNIIRNNIVNDFYSVGIEITDNDSTIISHNDIHRSNRSSSVGTFEGITLGGGNKNAIVAANRIHDTHTAAGTDQADAAYGVYSTADDAPAGAENNIINNLVYNFNSNTGAQYGIYNTGSNGTHYYHNTIVLDNQTSTSGTTRGFYQTTAASDIIFRNNIVLVSRAGSGVQHNLYFGTASSAIISNNNVLYNPVAGGSNGIGFLSTNFIALNDWQGANGSSYDQQSMSVDPLFYNAGSMDYTPFEPALNNIGGNVGVAYDIRDSSRNVAAPDPGAYEFSVGGCINPPTPGSAITANVNVCSGVDFTLDITSNSIGENQTYQWQSSADGIAWTNIGSTQTITAFTVSQTATTYYRAAVKCGSGTTVYSTSVQVITPLPVNGTFSINSNVPTGSGTFQTFADAINYIRCGINGPIVFNVEPGSYYNEQVSIPAIQGTSSLNTITINGNGATIDFTSTNTAKRAIVELDGADHVMIDSLNIISSAATTTEYAYGFRLLNDADNNTIKNSVITLNTTSTSTNYAGIVIHSSNSTSVTTGGDSQCDSNLIQRNIIAGGYYGVAIVGDGSNSFVVKNNSVINNSIYGFYSYGIYLNGGDNTLIEANDIHRSSRNTVTTFYGIYLTEKSINTRILRNQIHGTFTGNMSSTSASNGIYITGCDASAGNENIVANNIFYEFNNIGNQYALYNSSSDSVKYLYNSILLDGGTATSTYVTRGFYQTGAATGIDLTNNIFLISRPAAGQIQGFYFNTATTQFESDYNDIYISSTTGSTNSVAYYNGNNYTTLSDWKAAPVAQDQNSISADPLFNSYLDLHIQPASPVLNMGSPIAAVTNDIDNETRDLGVTEMGSDEIASPACSGATGGTATTTNADLCVSGLITINAAGFSTGSGSSYQWQISSDSTNWVDLTGETFPGSLITDSINATTYYRLKVSCTSGSSIAYSNIVSVNVHANPTVTINPAGPIILCEPATATLNVSATSASIASYQWMRNGVVLPSETSSSMNTSSSGNYTVELTDDSTTCSTISAPVIVTVNPQPSVITVTPSSPQVCPNSSAIEMTAGGGTISNVSIFNESFNGTAAGWLMINNTTGGTDPNAPAWTLRPNDFNQGTTFSSNDDSQFILSNSDEGGSGNNTHTILQSPAFNTSGFTSANLTFYHYYNDYNTADSAAVEISTDGTNWTKLQAYTTDQGTATNFTQANIDISAYAGNSTLYIRFRYEAVFGFYWAIDNLSVTGDQQTSFTWSPITNLYTDAAATAAYTGTPTATVYTNTDSTSVYTITATSAAGCITNKGVTVLYDTAVNNSTTLAGTASCASYDVSMSNNYFSNCSIIASITPSGSSPVSGNINVCVSIDGSLQTTTVGEPYVQRHYNITPANNATTATATITLYFLQSEFDAFNAVRGSFPALPANATDAAGIANLRITQFNGTGTAPGNYTGTSSQINPADVNIEWNAAGNRWEITFEVTGSGGFYAHTGAFVLPVSLINFTGVHQNGINKLSWSTATEKNNAGFEVQRSADGRSFNKTGWVASNTTSGNSNVIQYYNFTDRTTLAGNNYYRLKQIDKDGNAVLSNVILLRPSSSIFALQAMYPNPASNLLNLQINSPVKQNISITVTDHAGKMMMKKDGSIRAGANTEQLDIRRLATGVYMLKITGSNTHEMVPQRFIKQ